MPTKQLTVDKNIITHLIQSQVDKEPTRAGLRVPRWVATQGRVFDEDMKEAV